MDKIYAAMNLLPPDLKEYLIGKNPEYIEEIRLRCGKNPSFRALNEEKVMPDRVISRQEIARAVEIACGASLQAHLQEVKEGYINYRGLRIGVCGIAIYENDALRSFRNFSSLNIRIPHKFSGDISELVYKMRRDNYPSTLIISPPGYGKTSLLRELIKEISNDGKTLAVVDDRNELASIDNGSAYFDMGKNCDVLSMAKKNEGAMMLLRGMGPEMIAFDEISKKEDTEAIYEIAGCGVDILATVHGRSVESLRERALYRKLLDEKIFKSAISIDIAGNTRVYRYQRL